MLRLTPTERAAGGSDGAALPLLDPRVFGEVRVGAVSPGGEGGVLLGQVGFDSFDPERVRDLQRALFASGKGSRVSRKRLQAGDSSAAWRMVLISAIAMVAAGVGLVIGLLA